MSTRRNRRSLNWALGLITLAVITSTAAAHAPNPPITTAPGWGARLLGRAAGLRSANGINIDAQDRLYVTSVLERTISVINPRSGRIIEKLGPDQGVEAPDDLTFGPDGTLYWTAFMTGEVGAMSPDGEKRTVAQLAPGVNAITMSDDGRLFVTRVFLGDQLFEVDPAGVEPPRLVLEGMGGLNGMDFGPDGALYGPLWFLGQIARIDVDTGALTVVAEGFDTPAAVKFDRYGALHALDQHTGEVIKIDLETGAKQVVAQGEIGIDNLAFDSRNRLFVTNAHDGSVTRFRRSRRGWRGRGRSIVRPGLTSPGGVVVSGEGCHPSLYVSDTYSLLTLSARSGRLQEAIHSIVGDVTGVGTPLSLSSAGDDLVSTSWFARVVQVIDPVEGTIKATHPDFIVPVFATGFGEGDLLVSELGTHSVVLRPSGTTDKITVTSALYVPAGIAAEGGDAWVSDWATGVVWQIIAEGEILEQPIPTVTGLSHPEGLAIDGDTLYVVEAGAGALSAVSLATGAREIIAEDLPLGMTAPAGYPPTWIFNGVTVDEAGSVFVALDKIGRILKLKLDD